MSEYLTEQEQVEQLKKWIKEYGLTLLAGCLLAGLLIGAWHYYQQYHARITLHASAIYDELLAGRAQNDTPAVMAQGEKILRHYPSTPYAALAAMTLAREAVIQKNYPEAIKQLTWVMQHSKNSQFREVSRIRLARIYIAQQKPQAALDLLNKLNDRNFSGRADEVKGDAYLSMNDKAKARDAYKLALQELPNAEVTRPILQMKFDNLATSS